MASPPDAKQEAKTLARYRRNRRIGWSIAQAVKLIGRTLRYRLVDPRDLRRTLEPPVVFVVWHNRLLIALLCARRFLPKGRRLACLVSASADGEILAAGLEALGHTAARGSSSRQGSRGFREMHAAVERGDDAAITPDGPRGPRYVLKPGAVELARKTGAPIVPLIPTATRKAELRSWDRFQIPLPLARCTLEVGDPIFVQEMTDEEATAALAAALAKSTEPADEREPDRTRSLDDDRDAADAQGASGDPTPSRA